MTIIKPISDLRNNFNDIAELCHKEKAPVFITKNGSGELVVMSMAFYEALQARIELYEKLLESEQAARQTKTRISHQHLMKKLQEKLHEKV